MLIRRVIMGASATNTPQTNSTQKCYAIIQNGANNRILSAAFCVLFATLPLIYLLSFQVCGSYQCPYCPYYNGASTGPIGLVVGLLSALSSYFFVALLASDNLRSMMVGL